MKKNRFSLLLAFLLVPCIIFGQNEQIHSLQSTTAGGNADSETYQVAGTVGQSNPIGVAESEGYVINSGFIPAVLSPSDVTAPLVSHTTVSTADANADIPIEATVTDDSEILEVVLSYRQGGQSVFADVSLEPDGELFSGLIPADDVSPRGIEYYVSAVDEFDNVTRQPESGTYSIRVSVADEGLAKSSAQPSGSEQNAYRLISIPLNTIDSSPQSVLEDDLGEYDDTKWRLFRLRTDGTYAEYPNSGSMTPGRAFWLIVKDSGKIIDTGPATSNDVNELFSIPLNAGWTFIGNPFNFQIPLTQVYLENEGVLDIRSFSGAWQEFSGPLRPFDGYAVFSEEQTDLIVSPSDTSSGVPKPDLSKTVSKEENLWSISIHASSQQAKDIDTKIRIIADASPEWDTFDKPEPPVIGEYISVYFPHHEWDKIAQNYTVDARPEPSRGETWHFEVRSNVQEQVQLTIQNVDQIPQHFEVWIVDEVLKTYQNIREKDTYSIPQGSPDKPKSLSLLVGTQEYIQEELREMQLVPATYELAKNFPNPFSQGTNIRFGLPVETEVNLQIYDLRGRNIVNLIEDEFFDAGYHLIYWDGSDQTGQQVASGVYFYILRSSEGTLKEKMIIVK